MTHVNNLVCEGAFEKFTETMSGKKDANTALREQAEAVDKKIDERLEGEGQTGS